MKQQQQQQHAPPFLDAFRLAAIPFSMTLTYLLLSSVNLFTKRAPVLSLLTGILVFVWAAWHRVQTPIMFVYNCFLKPIGHHTDLQSRLESFYQHQANIYDDSRSKLLRGRKTMLRLCAAQLKDQMANGANDRLIWVDLGGGTGWNIEQMNEMFPIENFEQVILVDLTPSLCKVAEERFRKQGWTNVTVVCQDAATFQAPIDIEGRTSLVTMSYSLSMMDHFYPVVDRIQSLLSPDGVIGVTDFYVSGRSRAPAESRSPQQNRQCNWWTRVFWQIWFEFDHIQLAPGRRDYLEYKFGTLKNLNRRNHFIIPYLIQIPYYVWIGCSHARSSAVSISDSNSISSSRSGSMDSQKSPLLSPIPLSYQNRQWRLDYDPTLPCHTQFRSYIYAFTWEDPRVDLEFLNLTKDDVMLVITSAGDNALEYAIAAEPKRIHCVDMNPCQNHLLELKLASISCLSYADFWRLFGEGRHPQFSTLLHGVISPHLSPYAFQYWAQHADRFSQKFYKTGYSGLALTIFEWWARMSGITDKITALCQATSIAEQEELWQRHIRPALFSPIIRSIMNNPMFMWNALGVPINQMNMFLKEGTTQEYIQDTLDPIPSRSLFSQDQYFYYLCMMQQYSHQSCPTYLTRKGFEKLKTSNAMDAFRLHTDSILNTLQSLPCAYLTRMIVMDHMDWFDPNNCAELEQEISEMARVLQVGGQVYWRSAGKYPWYNKLFEKCGFKVEALGIRERGKSIDRVNMYASFYRGTLSL